MSHMCLTNLQKCDRARWQMLFHPTALTLEFYNPPTFRQTCISCASWAFTGWNVIQKTLLFIHDSSVTPSPSQQYFILIGPENPLPPPIAAYLHVLSFLCCDIVKLIYLRITAPQIRSIHPFSKALCNECHHYLNDDSFYMWYIAV
jgi:hypothetical protein